MFKCTGICSNCGRCKDSSMINGVNDRKTKILVYPADFQADIKESSEGENRNLGVAFDIGTTTVVGILWDLGKGLQLDSLARTNPQNEFGMDVISRITYCGRNGENLGILRLKITDCLSRIAAELCEKNKLDLSDVRKVTVCGNTTMSHLFAGYPPMSLAKAPFSPAYTGSLCLTANKALLNLPEDTDVFVFPNIAGHVGGDITAGIAASRLLDQNGLTLFIDIGTNGEIVLSDGKDILTCSTAAGPAFEGASIRCGMRAAIGSIEKVKVREGEVLFRTIGEAPAQGICGSGIIDVIAEMLKAHLIDHKGRLAASDEWEKKGFDERLKPRLMERDGERQFVLMTKDNGGQIVITQNDIREVQLAKGAIKAGIQLLLEDTGKRHSDIEHIFVAGAFGNYINHESAVQIGILPDIPQEKFISIGNAAGCGVSMALASQKERELVEKIPQLVKHIELAQKENFQNAYVKAMGFTR